MFIKFHILLYILYVWSYLKETRPLVRKLNSYSLKTSFHISHNKFEVRHPNFAKIVKCCMLVNFIYTAINSGILEGSWLTTVPSNTTKGSWWLCAYNLTAKQLFSRPIAFEKIFCKYDIPQLKNQRWDLYILRIRAQLSTVRANQ